MLNKVDHRLWTGRSPNMQESRFIAFLGYQQGRKPKGQEDFILLPCRIARSTALESLLSVALSFVGQMNCIIQFLLEIMGSLSLLKWAHFQY
jgi:hypothetical protein